MAEPEQPNLTAAEQDALSRQLAVFGVAGQAKIKKSHVLVSGMGALGIEIAKNICLAGVKAVTIHDTVNTTPVDVNGNFYLSQSDIGSNRAESTLPKLQNLNPHVTVNCRTDDLSSLEGITVLVATEMTFDRQLELNAACRAAGIRFISSDVKGVFGSCFVDFGDDFATSDENGLPPIQCMLSNISCANPCVVTTVSEGVDPKTGKNLYKRHGLSDGEVVRLTGVKGLRPAEDAAAGTPLEGTDLTVTVIDSFNFSVELDSSDLRAYGGGATFIQVKQPKPIPFKSLEQNVEEPTFVYPSPDDYKQWNTCFTQTAMHLSFRALSEFQKSQQRLPRSWCTDDAAELVKIARELNEKSSSPIELTTPLQ